MLSTIQRHWGEIRGRTDWGRSLLAKHSRGTGLRACDVWRGRTMGASGDRMALLNAAPPGLLLSCRCGCAAQSARRTKGGRTCSVRALLPQGGGSPRASGAPIWPIRGPRMTRISRAGRRNRHDSRRDEAPCSKVSSGKRHLRRGGGNAPDCEAGTSAETMALFFGRRRRRVYNPLYSSPRVHKNICRFCTSGANIRAAPGHPAPPSGPFVALI